MDRPGSHPFIPAVILLVLAALLVPVSAKPQSIGKYPGYKNQRPCAQTCFFTAISTSYFDTLGTAIGCQMSAGFTQLSPEDCYCRADLRTLAHETLDACINPVSTLYTSTGCAGDAAADAATAKSIYDGYCATVRGPIKDDSSSSATGSSNTGSSNTGTPGATNTGAANSGAGSNSGGGSNTAGGTTAGADSSNLPAKSEEKSGLSTGDIIGIAIGVPTFVVTVLGIVWGVRKKKHSNKPKPAENQLMDLTWQRPPPQPPQPHIQIFNGNWRS